MAGTLEFKPEAVQLVKAGQSIAAVAGTLGLPAQSISNWVKAEREGKLGGAGTKPVSAEQMELARLRAEVALLKMEHDILKNACAYFEKVYLAVVIDLFNRQVVGWSMQPHMKAELVTDALRMAWFRRHPEAGVI
ncbi:hypothetical protein DFQ30_010753, partial [Apophysomyces sp. BC1015]